MFNRQSNARRPQPECEWVVVEIRTRANVQRVLARACLKSGDQNRSHAANRDQPDCVPAAASDGSSFYIRTGDGWEFFCDARAIRAKRAARSAAFLLTLSLPSTTKLAMATVVELPIVPPPLPANWTAPSASGKSVSRKSSHSC